VFLIFDPDALAPPRDAADVRFGDLPFEVITNKHLIELLKEEKGGGIGRMCLIDLELLLRRVGASLVECVFSDSATNFFEDLLAEFGRASS
jgi:hypothetical protein